MCLLLTEIQVGKNVVRFPSPPKKNGLWESLGLVLPWFLLGQRSSWKKKILNWTSDAILLFVANFTLEQTYHWKYFEKNAIANLFLLFSVFTKTHSVNIYIYIFFVYRRKSITSRSHCRAVHQWSEKAGNVC